MKFIPKEVTKEELENVFKKAGEIASIKLKQNESVDPATGQKIFLYQIGYVLFKDVKSA